MHGRGIYTYSNGRKYEGEFVSGFMEGYGKLVLGQNMYYEGEWKSGFMRKFLKVFLPTIVHNFMNSLL
jgi:hypothetical protein